MTPPPRLAVHTDRAWLVADLAAAGTAIIRQDHPWAQEPPRDGEAIWAPGGWATRMAKTGYHLPLQSTGGHWLQELSALHPGLLGRTVLHGTVAGLPARWAMLGQGPLFAKPAEAKIEALPARVYSSPDDLLEAVGQAGYPDTLRVIASEPVGFGPEFRCFIADGTVKAASYYWDESTHLAWDGYTGSDGEPTADLPDATDAARFAGHVARVAIEDGALGLPDGVVLDVARLRDHDGTLGRWVVIESNAAWSSNPYHADAAGVIAAVLASQRPGSDERFRFRPDPVLLERALPLRAQHTGRI